MTGITSYFKERPLFFLLLLSLQFFYVSCVEKKSIVKNETSISAIRTDTQGQSLHKQIPIIPGDFADPSVIRKGNVYYATGTSSEWAPHFQLFQSTDLLHWQLKGYVFSKTPAWASASFWAPELFYRKGTYFVYYVARKKRDGISCIGVATSTDPAKGFTDRGILLEFGKEAIDPFVIEDDGKLYITWKAYGLDPRPIELLGSRLSDDGLKVEGEPFTLLVDNEKKGLEGQCLVKRNGFYYLFYSVGNCCGVNCSYQVEVARSTSLKGPYTRFSGKPILSQTNDWKCMGHGTIVTSKEGKDFYMYHAYSKADNIYTGRQGSLGEVFWDAQTGWPQVKPVSTEIAGVNAFRDDFSNSQLSDVWQWDFRHSEPEIKVEKDNLYLTGQITTDNETGTAITVRPLSGSYEIKTEVTNHNSALKGLVLYGDAGQSAGIGVKDDTIQVWKVKKGKRLLLQEEKIVDYKTVQFKMKVEKGYQCRFYWSKDGTDWKGLGFDNGFYNANFLPPWDRSPRPGLMQRGNTTEPAAFSYFEIAYR